MLAAMPPHMLSCPFCDRLFTRFSIGVHEPQCADNPYKKVKRHESARLSVTAVGRAQRLPAIDRRSRSVGSGAAAKKSASLEDFQARRPGTTTIDRPPSPAQRNSTAAASATTSASTALCFVCGQRVAQPDLLDHEVECEALWRTARRSLPAYMRTKSPRKMRIPSVDGTVDPVRMDMYASESAERAQSARCLKCLQKMQFEVAAAHQCTRFQPTVQFYF